MIQVACTGNFIKSRYTIPGKFIPGDRGFTQYLPPGGGAANPFIAFFNKSTFYRFVRRSACPGYNAMAYDPTKTYTPWVGLDNAGNAYTNMTVANALNNPYLATGTATNVSNHYYWI